MGAAASVTKGNDDGGQMLNIFGDHDGPSSKNSSGASAQTMTWIVTPELCGDDVGPHCIVFDKESFQVSCDHKRVNVRGTFTPDGNSAFRWTTKEDKAKLEILVLRNNSNIKATFTANGKPVEEMVDCATKDGPSVMSGAGKRISNLAGQISHFFTRKKRANGAADNTASSKLSDYGDGMTAAAKPMAFATGIGSPAPPARPRIEDMSEFGGDDGSRAKGSQGVSERAMMSEGGGEQSDNAAEREGLKKQKEMYMERALLRLGRIGFDTDDSTRAVVENAGGDITVAVAMLIAMADGKNQKVFEAVEKLTKSNESLVAMGFLDKNLNLNMLIQSGGDVSNAASILLRDPHPHRGSTNASQSPQTTPMTAAAAPSKALAEVYRAQLESLHQMGFLEDSLNLSALDSCGGDVDRAIAVIISDQKSSDGQELSTPPETKTSVKTRSTADAVAAPIMQASDAIATPIVQAEAVPADPAPAENGDAVPSGK